ncbi:hypothetical protein [Brevundimonas aveniformis]|uniref:hypothetical protein n=1 Tax=Brevundimonas aveniformis TaxID=370977 RepID=UPI0004097B90|nr:hypothetical protein [Brevundimonas aveniformis]
MLDTLYSQLGAIVWLGVCAFALLKGDKSERMAGGALVIAWLATLAVHRDTNLTSVTIPVFLIDMALLALLIGLSWRSDRNWPVWAAAFQSIVVLVHVVTLVDLRIRAIAYLSAQTVGTYGVLICLAVGTFWAWQTREAIRPREDDLH